MKSVQLLTGVAVLSLLFALPPRVQAQTPGVSALSGDWTLNREKSDNPQERISAAMRAQTESTDKPTGTGRGGGSARSASARVASESGAVKQNDDRGIYRKATQEVVFGGEALHIGATDDAVVIEYAGRPALSVKANGKRESAARFGAGEAQTKAEWKKDKLTIETDANDGLATREEYELSEKNGVKQLQVVAQMRLTNGEMVRVKRVYDAKPAGG
jgi:hypothetical protein